MQRVFFELRARLCELIGALIKMVLPMLEMLAMGLFWGRDPVRKFLVSSTTGDISFHVKSNLGTQLALGKERVQIFSLTNQSVGETTTACELVCKTSGN